MGGQPDGHSPRQLLDSPLCDAILCIQADSIFSLSVYIVTCLFPHFALVRHAFAFQFIAVHLSSSQFISIHLNPSQFISIHLCPCCLSTPPCTRLIGNPVALSTTLTTIWLETCGISFAFTFLIVDVVVIIVRNNLSCTSAILARRRYQVIEKFVVAPIVGLYKLAEGMLCRLLC